MTLLVHIAAGALGLLSGYVALYAAKGAPLHRRSGILFVVVMLTLSVTGMLISAIEGVAPAMNIPSAVLTFYLVITALTTVRPQATGSRSLDLAAMIAAFVLGLACFALAVKAIATGGAAAGMAYPLFMFGAIALAAGAGDRRMIRAGGVRGPARLKRHLWRMCFALFVASMAFYLGPGRVPEAIRIPALIAAAVMAPLLAIIYWLWRLGGRHNFGGIAAMRATTVAPRVEVSPALGKVS
jgi:uncharacterized membrane protein